MASRVTLHATAKRRGPAVSGGCEEAFYDEVDKEGAQRRCYQLEPPALLVLPSRTLGAECRRRWSGRALRAEHTLLSHAPTLIRVDAGARSGLLRVGSRQPGPHVSTPGGPPRVVAASGNLNATAVTPGPRPPPSAAPSCTPASLSAPA